MSILPNLRFFFLEESKFASEVAHPMSVVGRSLKYPTLVKLALHPDVDIDITQ